MFVSARMGFSVKFRAVLEGAKKLVYQKKHRGLAVFGHQSSADVYKRRWCQRCQQLGTSLWVATACVVVAAPSQFVVAVGAMAWAGHGGRSEKI